MTEAEWLACTDPDPMLEFLGGKVSDRRLRLFACACCRGIWHLLHDPRSRDAVEVAERYAEGGLTEGELYQARLASHDAYMAARAAESAAAGRPGDTEWEHYHAASIPFAAYATTSGPGDADYAAESVLGLTLSGYESPRLSAKDLAAMQVSQPDLLRDIFGNLFRPATFDPDLRAWHGGILVKLAEAAYEERELPSGFLDTSRLAVLADALEEAVCTDRDLLGHLRGPGPHVRGCWVVDALLGLK